MTNINDILKIYQYPRHSSKNLRQKNDDRRVGIIIVQKCEIIT